jgi:hypothetical protein
LRHSARAGRRGSTSSPSPTCWRPVSAFESLSDPHSTLYGVLSDYLLDGTQRCLTSRI